MAATFAVLLLVLSVFGPPRARAQGAALGCGLPNVKFDVETESRPPVTPRPKTGKALVFFLQDNPKNDASRPTTRFGIDGAWVGATRDNSYFYVAVEPGEHAVCADWELHTFRSYFGPKGSADVAHFMADAGKSYYFRARHVVFTDRAGRLQPEVNLARLGDDEARTLMRSLRFSSCHQRR